VSQGRGMDEAPVRQVATGEVFTAVKAKSLGLIDELGDLERAIDIAAELGNVPRRPVYMRPRRNLRELIATMVGTSLVDSIAARLEERLAARYYFLHRF
jgi:ClpP class serine protease